MVEIRNPSADELRAAMTAGQIAFGEEQRDDDFERQRLLVPLERFLGAYDSGRPVATAGVYPFELTIPGGQLPTAGVTWVAVLPSHRRQGILTRFMERLLADARERGEPLAALWASEAAIYGRFGYGIATQMASIDAEREGFAFREDPGPSGSVRLVERTEAVELLPPVYERIRTEIPGMLSRARVDWEHSVLVDSEHIRDGAGPKLVATLELDGRLEGYAVYRIKSHWEKGFPRGQVRVREALATTPAATRELWRFLFAIDLTTRVEAEWFDPGSPLFLMVVDPRRLQLRTTDGLWLRFVDVEAALRARSYAADDAVVLELRDALCPGNAGRWRVGSDGVERTDADADLSLDSADLASAYLGAFDFHELAVAERVRELRAGAIDRATALFRTPRPPYCPEEF